LTPVRVKICGLKEPRHGAVAARAGADYVGVVFAERARRVTPEEARAVVDALDGSACAVGVFVDAPKVDILRHRDLTGFDAAQLHGAESPADCRALQEEGLIVWKAIRPTSREDLVGAWQAFAGVADAILVEGFSPDAAGGTGSGFPHEWLSTIDRVGSDLVLAGGLDNKNVATAIRVGRPDIVDVSSGVEARLGVKSVDRIEAFLAAAKGRVSVVAANTSVEKAR